MLFNRERALQKLELCGLLPHFHAVVTGSDVAHPKPAPDIYLRVAELLDVDARECVIFEDSPSGIRAARGRNGGTTTSGGTTQTFHG